MTALYETEGVNDGRRWSLSLDAAQNKDGLTLNVYEYDSGLEDVTGSDDYEASYCFSLEETEKLARAMERKHPDMSFFDALAAEFGTHSIEKSIQEFCAENGVKYIHGCY